MGSPCLFPRQQALKMGYFYWLRVKNSNHLHTELSLHYTTNTKFSDLESKASFIHISNIASFTLSKPFLNRFSDRSMVNLRSSPWPKYTQNGAIFQKKKIMFYYQTSFFLQICFLLLDCSWGHRARLREK